ncbi:MAG TPA: hypothetical protein VKP30_04665 [Polyangiaceae bacterium]|nr:hypothetical protein [Polyangiaceae bacterium]
MNNNPSHRRRDARLDNEPLWLTVARDGKSKSYEFPPGGDDTTVVVGSSDRVQVRVAGAAPIAFYVERVENDLCITSCYLGSNLCIDGHVVSGRRTIVGCATVELAGARLVLSVRDNPPTLPGCYMEVTPEAARASASSTSLTSSPVAVAPSCARLGPHEKPPQRVSQTALVTSASPVSSPRVPLPNACSVAPRLPAPSDSLEKARDAYSDVLDAWFDATFLSDPKTKNAPPKLDEPSAVRTKPAPLKQVSVPPRPPPIMLHPYSDLAETRELAPIRLMAITEELETIELGPASGNGDAPTERAIRIGATTTPGFDSELVIAPTSAESSATPRLLPSAPPRQRHPLLFLLGAVLGTFLPALCLVGVGRLAVLSRNTPNSRTHSTYAAKTAASHSPQPSADSTTVGTQYNAVTQAVSMSSANRVPLQPQRLTRRSPRAAASSH